MTTTNCSQNSLPRSGADKKNARLFSRKCSTYCYSVLTSVNGASSYHSDFISGSIPRSDCFCKIRCALYCPVLERYVEQAIRSKVALISGSGRGIGRAVALNLAKARFSVGLIGRTRAELEKVASECRDCGVEARIFPLDLRRTEQIPELVRQVADELGGITVLINNAGVWIEKDIRQARVEEWESSFDINLRSVFVLTKCAIPYLEKSEQAAIINISSTAAHRGYAGGTMYAATKHGLAGFSASLFEDLRELGIKVCEIAPGYVNTAMHQDDLALDPAKMLRPEDVAHAVNFVVGFPSTGCPTQITIVPQKSPKLSKK